MTFIVFSKLNQQKSHNYNDNEIDLFEYVVESRLKKVVDTLPMNSRDNLKEKERQRNITWKQLTSLKQSVAYFLQTQANRQIQDKNYDLKDY